MRAGLLYAKAGALFVIYLLVLVLLFYGRFFDDWNDQTPGQVAMYALAGLGLYQLLLSAVAGVGDVAPRVAHEAVALSGSDFGLMLSRGQQKRRLGG